jgi:two-component system sensor kinase FixL
VKESAGKISNPEVVLQLLNSIPVGIAVCNKDGIIRYINSALCQMFGYDQQELLNQKVDKLLLTDFTSSHFWLQKSDWLNTSTQKVSSLELFGR